MSDHKRILVYCLIILFVQNKFKILSCTPVQMPESNNNDTNDDDFNGDDSSNSVTEHGINAATRPNSNFVNLSNLSDPLLEFLRNNNINLTALRVQQEFLRAQKSLSSSSRVGSHHIGAHLHAPAPLTQTRVPHRDEDHHRREYEEGAIKNIKDIIENVALRNLSKSSSISDTSNEVTHEMAFHAECDMPRAFNETAWFNGDAWNIYFKIPMRRLSLQSAVLRIYKLPESPLLPSIDRKNCTETLEQLIRIKVYVYERRRKRGGFIEKRECSSLTVARKYEGWIEMDIKLAVRQWEKQNKNMGLSVEVQDINDNYLRTLNYFHPIDCNQASPTLPWTTYQYFLNYSSREMDNLPRQPRIDVKYKTPMNNFPSNSRFVRHNPHLNNNNHHHNHHRVLVTDDFLQNSAEAQASYEGHSEEIHVSNNQQSHKKRHFKHKLEHSLRKRSANLKDTSVV